MLRLRAPLVLASASPRRRELLARLGLDFDVLPSDADETWPDGVAPGEAAAVIALRKAAQVSRQRPDALVLGADTVVVLDGVVLGKPPTPEAARTTLRTLSGRTHTVYTGLALVYRTAEVTAFEGTDVTFAPLADAEIDAYVETGSPMDKAGSYGIQDLSALFVERIEGDFYNVVGLPLHRLYRTLLSQMPEMIEASPLASGGTPNGARG